MSTRSVRFNIDLTANPQAARQLEGALKRVGQTGRQAGDQMNRSWRGVGSTMGGLRSAIAALGAGLAFRAIIRNTIEQERVTAQLEARLRSTGRYTPELSKSLRDYASQLQNVTTFGDEAIIGAQALLLSFTQIGGETFPRATKAAADLATAMGMDLESATRTVGRALNDPIQGLQALSRMGITFSESQKAVIKEMVETGNVAKAQEMILGELETRFGGAAEAARNTLGGALAGLKNAFGDLLEGDSGGDGVRGATDAVNDLTQLLNSAEFKNGFAVMISGALNAVAALATFVTKVSDVTRFLGEEIASRVAGPAADDIVRIEQAMERLDARMASRGTGRSDASLATDGYFQRLVAQRAQLERQLELGRELQAMASRRSSTGAATPGALVPVLPGEGEESSGSRSTGRTPRTPTVRDIFGPAEAALQRQIGLYGEVGEAARIRYEVEQGSLAGLEEAQKARLLGLAGELDALRQKAEAEATTNEMRREAESLIEATYSAEERYVALVIRLDELMAAGVLTLEERTRVISAAADQLNEKVKEGFSQLDEFGIQAARNMQSAFAQYLFDGFDDGLQGMLRGFVDVLRKMLAEAVAAQLLKKLFGGDEGSGGGDSSGGFMGLFGAIAKGFAGGSAKGNVFGSTGMVKAFAKGGVVTGPMNFPMANGQFGLMGEAGPEAIMPLKRGAGGRLGVEMSGGGASAPPPPVNVRSITVIGEQNLADVMFTAGNERVIVNYLDRLGFQPSRS